MNTVLDFAHAKAAGRRISMIAAYEAWSAAVIARSRSTPFSSATRPPWCCTVTRRRWRQPCRMMALAHGCRRASGGSKLRHRRPAVPVPPQGLVAGDGRGRGVHEERRSRRQARRRRRQRRRHSSHDRLRRARDGTHRPDATVSASARRIPRTGQDARTRPMRCRRQAHTTRGSGLLRHRARMRPGRVLAPASRPSCVSRPSASAPAEAPTDRCSFCTTFCGLNAGHTPRFVRRYVEGDRWSPMRSTTMTVTSKKVGSRRGGKLLVTTTFDDLCAWRASVPRRLAPARRSGSCRRWARSTKVISPWSGAAVAENDRTLVSIFVNPTQFDDPRDLAALSADTRRRSRRAAVRARRLRARAVRGRSSIRTSTASASGSWSCRPCWRERTAPATSRGS